MGDVAKANKQHRHMRAVVYYASLENDIPLEQKAKGLGLTIGEYLVFCWDNDLMPHPAESNAMKLSIRTAIEETLHGNSVEKAAEKIGICVNTVKTLLRYRGERKVRFFKNAETLQTLYELYCGGWTDEDISEALQIEAPYVEVITSIFFKKKHNQIGFQSR